MPDDAFREAWAKFKSIVESRIELLALTDMLPDICENVCVHLHPNWQVAFTPLMLMYFVIDQSTKTTQSRHAFRGRGCPMGDDTRLAR